MTPAEKWQLVSVSLFSTKNTTSALNSGQVEEGGMAQVALPPIDPIHCALLGHKCLDQQTRVCLLACFWGGNNLHQTESCSDLPLPTLDSWRIISYNVMRQSWTPHYLPWAHDPKNTFMEIFESSGTFMMSKVNYHERSQQSEHIPPVSLTSTDQLCGIWHFVTRVSTNVQRATNYKTCWLFCLIACSKLSPQP